MAESTLSIDVNTMRKLVFGLYQGRGRDLSAWTATDYSDWDLVSGMALRNFYFPPSPAEGKPFYEWSFLQKQSTITLLTSDVDYDLPDDFMTLLPDTLTYATGKGERRLEIMAEGEKEIRAMQVMENSAGYPVYAAVRNKAHNATSGQRYELTVYPTPTAVVNSSVLTYRYVYAPDILSNTNKYPAGGAMHSQTVLLAHYAAAEEVFDQDPAGPYGQKFQLALTNSIRIDSEMKGASLEPQEETVARTQPSIRK